MSKPSLLHWLPLAAFTLFGTGCAEDEAVLSSEAPEILACRYFGEGPSLSVDAKLNPDEELASVASDHRRYDVQLPEGATGREGWVELEVFDEVPLLFFLGADIPISLQNEAGEDVELEFRTPQGCDQLQKSRRALLPTGTHRLKLGPAVVTQVALVLEEDTEATGEP